MAFARHFIYSLRNYSAIPNTLREESVCGRNFCSFWKIRKSLFPQKVTSIVNHKIFFPAKRSSVAEPQKFIPVKCLFPKQNTMNTSSQWKSLEFKDDLEI